MKYQVPFRRHFSECTVQVQRLRVVASLALIPSLPAGLILLNLPSWAVPFEFLLWVLLVLSSLLFQLSCSMWVVNLWDERSPRQMLTVVLSYTHVHITDLYPLLYAGLQILITLLLEMLNKIHSIFKYFMLEIIYIKSGMSLWLGSKQHIVF